ncbi:transcriptional regulator, LysR family [Microbulbifer donghaiensis]|uniref:Transcriptional regulator, LysR family n=1 Tax=Microbulbifer donghaiensis TaxID=494016 RepID=A0A1M5AKQ7_9GAMM|nr:LysR substrate-binding domain-containing protein [Microbulbifer donghaiensis]SHF30736.1 transcriptional regulator, LysR family [Microbulbifer donghaiensis]
MQNWEGVSEFVAVVEQGSFTAAAARLDISTAQVSRQVSALEGRLGTKLLYRTTRKVTVTELGQVYYRLCRQALDGLQEAELAVTRQQQVPRGRLRLTAPVAFGEKTIAPLLNDFAVRYPELEVELQLTNQQLDLVAEGYDLAVRLGRLKDSSLMAKRLASRTLYVCGSPEYLSRYGEPHSLSELERHNCLRGTLDDWRFQEGGKSRDIRVGGSLRCNSGWALLDATLKGMGLVQLPDFYVQRYLQSGALVAVLENFRRADEGIWAIYPQNRFLSPKVRLLLDHLAQALPGTD